MNHSIVRKLSGGKKLQLFSTEIMRAVLHLRKRYGLRIRFVRSQLPGVRSKLKT